MFMLLFCVSQILTLTFFFFQNIERRLLHDALLHEVLPLAVVREDDLKVRLDQTFCNSTQMIVQDCRLDLRLCW
jgi:hypothetical protein